MPTDDEKNTAYYSAMVNGWINSAMEHDKSILTLSAGGIGLLIGFQKDFGISNITDLILYILSLLFFIISLISIVFIFNRNKKHYENVIRGNDKDDIILSILDKITVCSFWFALILTSIMAISLSIQSYNQKQEQTMNNKKQINESVNKINKIAPSKQSNFYQNSCNKISNMKPATNSNDNKTKDKNE